MSEMRQAIGWILDVAQVPIGSQLIGNYAAGVTVLTVSDAEPFAEQGGTVSIGGSVLAYTSANSDTDTITLAAAIGFATLDGDDVLLYDDIRAGIAAEFEVTVEFQNDLDGDDDSAPATLAHGLGDRIPSGVRNGRGETVLLQRAATGSTWTVVDVLGTELSMNGTYITPGTVPPAPTLTDGLVPATSPTPAVGVGIGVAVLSWTPTPNADLVTYDVYMNQTAPVPEDTAHRVATTTSSVISVDRIKATWHVIIRSRDADGPCLVAGNDVQFVIAQDAASLQADLDAAAAKVAAKPRIVFATTQPVPVGTEKILWYNTANGYTASYFDGATWGPYTLGTGAIAAGAITATLIGPLAVTAAAVAANAITASAIAADAVTAAAIAANAVTASELSSGAVTAAALAADAVTAAAIAVGAITAPKVGFTIGGGNLLSTSRPYDATTSGGWLAYQSTIASSTAVAREVNGRSYSVTSTVASDYSNLYRSLNVGLGATPVLPSRNYVASMWVYHSLATARDFQIEMEFQTDGGANYSLLDSPVKSVPPNTWTRVVFPFTSPAIGDRTAIDGYFAATAIGEVVYMTDFQIEEGDLVTAYAPKTSEILPGTITTTKIADDSITSPKVIAGAIVAGKIAANTITATEIAADTITATQIAANAITASEISAGAIVAGKIAAGTIAAADIAAGAITTAQLNIASVADNVAINGSKFLELDPLDSTMPKFFVRGGWPGGNALTSAQVAVDNATFDTSVRSIKLVTTATGPSPSPSVSNGTAVPVVPGETWFVTVRAKASVALAGLYIRLVTQGNGEIYGPATTENQSVTTAWATYSGSFTIPAGVTTVRAFVLKYDSALNTSVWVDSIAVQKVGVSVRIADGTITTPKLVVGAVTAATIAASTITAGQIAAGTITAGQIAAVTITASQIAAGTISAAQIAAGTITAVQITAGTITAGLMAADSIVSANIAAGTIQATDIQSGTITATQIAATTITAANIVAGTVTAQQIAALTITGNLIAATTVTAANIAAGTITATNIAAATITGTQIAAGSITTTHLTVASLGSDLIRNGRFLDAGSAGNVAALWSDQSGGGGTFYRELSANAPGGVWQVLQNPGGAAFSRGESAAFAVTPGDVLTMSCAAAATSATCPFYFRIGWFATDPGASYASEGDTTTDVVAGDQSLPTTYTAPETWRRVAGQVTVPAGKRFARITVYNFQGTGGYIVISDVQLRKVLPSVSIADGAIIAAKIAAGAITAEKLTIASLGAELVRDGGFEENTSWSYGASASRPAAAAHSGSVGLRCSASGGAAALSAIYPVAAGQIYSVGCWALGSGSTFYLRTSWLNSAGTEITITDTPAGVGVPGTWTRYDTQVTAPAGAVKAQTHIYNTTGTVDVDDVDVKQVIVAAHIADGAITAAKITATAIDGKTITGGIISNANVYMNADFLRVGVAYSGSPYGEVKIDANGYYTGNSYDPVIKMGTPGAKGVVQYGQIWLAYGSGFKTDTSWTFQGNVTAPNIIGPVAITNGVQIGGGLSVGANITYTNAPAAAPAGLFNAMLNSSNVIYKSNTANSSKRYKNKVKPLKVDVDALLLLEPRVFHWNKKLLAEGVPDLPDLGVIAEEVDALGLTEWVLYDDEGRPDGFRYDKWPMALQIIVRSQADRLAALEAKLDALLAAA